MARALHYLMVEKLGFTFNKGISYEKYLCIRNTGSIICDRCL
jgi:hypothetical protein